MKYPAPAPTYPARNAGPNKVRAYLAHCFMTKHDIPQGDAAQLAQKWQWKRGSALRREAPWSFESMFGWDKGAALYDSVHEDWARSPEGRLSTGKLPQEIGCATDPTLHSCIAPPRRPGGILLWPGARAAARGGVS